MATEEQMILIMALTIIGGVTSAVLDWADSGDPFDMRKFIALIVRSAIGAASTAFSFQNIADITPFIYLMAFLAGAGVDTLGTLLQGSVASKRANAVKAKAPKPPS